MMHWLMYGKVNIKSKCVKEQDVRNAAMDLYHKLLDDKKVWDFENPLLFNASEKSNKAQIYSPNDPFAPVLFIENQPLLLNSHFSATGVHRYTFLMLLHLIDEKQITVEIINPDLDSFCFGTTQFTKVQKLLYEKSRKLCCDYLK